MPAFRVAMFLLGQVMSCIIVGQCQEQSIMHSIKSRGHPKR